MHVEAEDGMFSEETGQTHDAFPSLPLSDSLLWQQVASSREECVQIDALIPGGHYQFRVRASNHWGVGPPSEPSNMVTLSSTSKLQTCPRSRPLLIVLSWSMEIGCSSLCPDAGFDGTGIHWKENFESMFSEICEIGR